MSTQFSMLPRNMLSTLIDLFYFSDSDSEAQASKQLIGKRKDKKDKDIGYAALGDSSGDEDEDGK